MNFDMILGAILRDGMQLTHGKRIESPRKLFHLIMQSDCNLVIYRNSNGKAIWYFKPDTYGYTLTSIT
jgi:hypothetical protein